MNTVSGQVLERSESGIEPGIADELEELERKNEKVDNLRKIKEETRRKMSQVQICCHPRDFALNVYGSTANH